MNEVYKYLVRGEDVYNEEDGQEKVAEGVKRVNTPEYLASIFQNQEVIYTQDFKDGTKIHLVHPTGPYTDRALMLTAYNENFFTADSDSNPNTHFIYEFSDEVQYAWWSNIVAGLKTSRQILEEEGREDVAIKYVENSTRVSNHQFRTSRTLIIPHGQFVERDPKLLKRHEMKNVPEHEVREKQLLYSRRNSVNRFMNQVREKMSTNTANNFEVASEHPLGYGFRIPLDTQQIAPTMKSHHLAYKEMQEKYKKELIERRKRLLNPSTLEQVEKSIEAPSYRLYVGLDGNEAVINISPEVISYAGVMQGWGIHLIRKPNVPLRITTEEKHEYGRRFGEQVMREMGRAS